MSKKMMQVWVGMIVAGLSLGAAAQNFSTSVLINQPGTSSARFGITTGEGSASMKTNDGFMTLENPDGTARLTIRNGSLGVGTITPAQKIHLFQSGTAGCRL